MSSEFQEKIRTIGAPRRRGTSQRKRVVDERDGSTAGYEVEHWDDRQDAVAQPKPIKIKLKVNEEE